MKKYCFLLLLSGILTGVSVSCSDDHGKDPYTPGPPEISIRNLSGTTACLTGETIRLKAELESEQPAAIDWFLNGDKVSTDTVYRFVPDKAGSFKVVLTATNREGTGSDSLSIEVTDRQFRFTNIKHWTGEGENHSALAIQWVTGDNLLEPADDEVFFIAWGYRWKNAAKARGIDMLKAIAENDPRFYVAMSGDYIVGFGYDGNGDGKIELQNTSLHLTQANFTDGLYVSDGGNFDGLKPSDPDDYWMGGLYETYATYWLGYGDGVPEAADFEYSSLFVSNRELENLSWDVWTLSPFDNIGMRNTLPIPRLIQAAEADK